MNSFPQRARRLSGNLSPQALDHAFEDEAREPSSKRTDCVVMTTSGSTVVAMRNDVCPVVHMYACAARA